MTRHYCRHCNERIVAAAAGWAALGRLANPEHGNPYTCTPTHEPR